MTKTVASEAVAVPAGPSRVTHEAEGGAGGAVAGAALGALAGPPGIAVGALLGAVVGALAGAALSDDAAARALEDEQLDRDIGVSEGDIGAPNLKHPPAQVGAISSPEAGASAPASVTDEPADGPVQAPPG